MRAWLLVALVSLTGCGTFGGEELDPDEQLRLACPDYYARSTPEERFKAVNRVIVPGYPECVIRHAMGEPQGREPVPGAPDAEWWFYDRNPGYLQITFENGALASWSRCEYCKRWYKD